MGIVSTLPLQQMEEEENGTHMLWAKKTSHCSEGLRQGWLEIQRLRQMNTRAEA